MTFKILPNLLTLLRGLLCPIAAYYFLESRFQIGSALFLFLWATDFFDGFLARKLRAKSPLGSWLDPACDQFCLIVFFSVLMVFEVCPPWFLGLLITVSLLQTLG